MERAACKAVPRGTLPEGAQAARILPAGSVPAATARRPPTPARKTRHKRSGGKPGGSVQGTAGQTGDGDRCACFSGNQDLTTIRIGVRVGWKQGLVKQRIPSSEQSCGYFSGNPCFIHSPVDKFWVVPIRGTAVAGCVAQGSEVAKSLMWQDKKSLSTGPCRFYYYNEFKNEYL